MLDWPTSFNALEICALMRAAAPKTDGWSQPVKPPPIEKQNLDHLKQAFAYKLAAKMEPFDAACAVISDVGLALWASQNWLNDPAVLAIKEQRLKKIENEKVLLDKNQLAAKALLIADDTAQDAKDRIAALKLYSDIAGYTGKSEINNSINSNNLKVIKLSFVKPDTSEAKTIEHSSALSASSNLEAVKDTGVKIKLVKSA